MASKLYRALCEPERLRLAWGAVRGGGKTPGIDGVSLAAFERNLDAELAALATELRGGFYAPWPARRLYLPKTTGGFRAIGVPAVRDRVVQRTLLPALMRRVEPRLEENAWAFRPGRSIQGALRKLEGWRGAGMTWVARTDVRRCFDEIEHNRLEPMLRAVLPEDDVRALVRGWLTAGASAGGRIEPADGDGLPQGDVLSPLLCNLFLDPFDEAMPTPHLRYADDIVLVGHSELDVRTGLDAARAALEGLGLEANVKKEWVGTFDEGFVFLGAAICGATQLPLHPAGPGKWTVGYGEPPPQAEPPLAPTDHALAARFVALRHAAQHGRLLDPIEAAFLDAWQALPIEDRLAEGWQAAYAL